MDKDDEYTIANGVTTFKLTKATNHLVCLMRNPRLPNLYQITNYVNFDPTGIDGVSANNDIQVQLVNGGITVVVQRTTHLQFIPSMVSLLIRINKLATTNIYLLLLAHI